MKRLDRLGRSFLFSLLCFFCLSLFFSFYSNALAGAIDLEKADWIDELGEGYSFFEDGKIEKSLERFKSVVKVKPDLWEAWFKIGRCYEKLAEMKENKERLMYYYKLALDAYGEIPLNENKISRLVKFHRKNIKNILSIASKEGEVPVRDDFAWMLELKKGKDAYISGEYDSAVDYFRKVAEEKPDLYEANLGLIHAFEKKALRSASLHERIEYLDMAMAEFMKIPRKNPKFQDDIKSIRGRLRTLYEKTYDFKIHLGQTKSDVVTALGPIEEWQEKQSERHYPVGAVREIRYDNIGVRFGLKDNVVFSIEFGSNFKGIIYGVKINDSIEKVRCLYSGIEKSMTGNYKGLKVDKPSALYIFNVSDGFVNMIKLHDPIIYGEWNVQLR